MNQDRPPPNQDPHPPEQDSPPPDRERAEPSESRQRLEENLKSRSTWLRLVFMLVFVVLYGIAEFVTGAVVLIQFFWVLFNGERNERLRELGQSLATYMYQITVYLTFNSDLRPFPFDADWPPGPPQG